MVRFGGGSNDRWKRRPWRAGTAALLGVLVFPLGIFLAGEGLDKADKWASVLGLFLNVIGATAAMTGLWLAWQTRTATHSDFAAELEAEKLRPSDPKKVGGFRLIGRVGMGAMGQVYLGHAPDGMVAAVKVMRSDLAENPVFRRRFEHELRDMEQVSGPRFPTLLTADASAERPWLATEYQPGMTLADAIDIGGPWSPAALSWLAAGIAEALSGIHTLGIVHRDLKPSNVLIDENGPQLIDFGIARATDDTHMTSTGAIVGTYAFMAPEQARGDRDIGPAADVFALGSLLVFAANGKPPFGEGSGDEVLVRIRSRRPDLGVLSSSREPIVNVIRACLHKDPTKRPSLEAILQACGPQPGTGADLLPEPVRARIAHRRDVIDAVHGGGDPAGSAGRGGLARWLPGSATTRAIATVVVVALVATVSWWHWWPRAWESALQPCSGPAELTLRIASSADKSVLLQELATGYGPRSAAGQCVEVVVDEVNSGKGKNHLVRGWPAQDGQRPDVWSPASIEWLELARQQGGPDLAAVLPAGAQPIVTTPLVIAMPRPMAEALGWPDNKDIGWGDLAELATDADGWSRYGHPEWGRFRLGKTNPHYSTSGFNATVAAFYAAGTTQSGRLVDTDVSDDGNQQFVRDIEQSIVHYGETSLHFLRNLRRAEEMNRALSYISAVTVEENSMLAYNIGHPDGTSSQTSTAPTTKLVAIYPKEGTIDSDHPYITLNWPDTGAAKREVAADFLDYLHSTPVQRRFQEYGFRDYRGNPGPLATMDNGVDRDATITRLAVPEGPVLQQVLSTWADLRKPANVLLVIDTSDSMNEGVTHKLPALQTCPDEQRDPVRKRCPTKMELVKNARDAIVAGFTDQDSAGLWAFSENLDGDRDYRQLVEVNLLDERGKLALLTAIEQLTTNTYTALYDTIVDAVTTVAANHDENTINAVVVLTDGSDTSSTTGLTQLLQQLTAQTEKEPVRVFTIAYGFGSDSDSEGRSVLEQIAEATGAAKYDAKDPYSITEDLVAAVISNF